MIVTTQEAARIESGRKTQHRLPQHRVAPGLLSSVPIAVAVPNPHMGYDVYGAPKMEVVTRCRVTIAGVTPGCLSDATEEDAKAEGYRSRRELVEAFPKLPGAEADPLVWVLTFALDVGHRPRFLSTRVIAGRQGDYVGHKARALQGEPEVVTDSVLDLFAFDAHRRDQARIADARVHVAGLTLDEQVRALESEARARHVVVRDELRQIRRYGDRPLIVEHQLQRIRRKLGHATS